MIDTEGIYVNREKKASAASASVEWREQGKGFALYLNGSGIGLVICEVAKKKQTHFAQSRLGRLGPFSTDEEARKALLKVAPDVLASYDSAIAECRRRVKAEGR